MRLTMHFAGLCRVIITLTAALLAAPAAAQPVLADPGTGVLSLVASGSALPRVDGLTFDSFGNLFAALEVVGSSGGIVRIDKATGAVGALLAPISGADQVKLHTSGSLMVTSELSPPPGGVGGIYRVDLGYSGTLPTSANVSYLATAGAVVDNPEGLVVLTASGPYGSAGDLVVAEDRSGGRVLKVSLASSPAPTTELVGSSPALQRPEGLAFGDFAGRASSPALFVAETLANRVLRIDPAGNVAEFGNAVAVNLVLPDNLAFGPDGYLYVTEDVGGTGSGRIMRLAADGSYSTFASGFKKPAGMAFDPLTGNLYIAEQDMGRVWRVEFAAAAVPEPMPWALLAAGSLLLAWVARARRRRSGSCGS